MVEFDRLYDGCKVKVVDKFLPNFNIPFASRYEGRTVTVRAALSPMRIEIYEDGGEFLWVVYDFDYIVDECRLSP